ncbi:N-acetyltransferase 9-like protein [Hondaea fermentalgiana]|uniref:N-acetyltransferase 9-like protein n=1 Tax=Hondaea fermentalgiana TaxID=2315210 RepID=A0A2R5GES4_9STRA|nr:N-acetyltransferase 9-like protein [Hondaea fermentalgiana]|eukprot:GBG29065.1 N-acetyltransferase 9-like protein [Hondaea fermentalgiana]
MRTNWETRLVGKRVVLVPYRRQHVEKYHEWMKDPALLEATASEPLSVEEEYEMQASWRDDDAKCTFIILDASESEDAMSLDSQVLDKMVGDTNLFLQEGDETSDGEEGSSDSKAPPSAEIEIMIAEKSARRKKLASESLLLMMRYGIDALKLGRFVAKIGAANAPSLALFESLGYKRVAYAEAFEEHELHWNASDKEAMKMLPALCLALDTDVESDVYETTTLVDQYMSLHFGGDQSVRSHENAPMHAVAFPVRCAQLLTDLAAQELGGKVALAKMRALDLGCAVGGASFELSKTFAQALGIDKSSSFIARAKALRDAFSGAKCEFHLAVEGGKSRNIAVELDANVRRARVEFSTGDACDLGAISAVSTSAPYHAALLANLLCRLPDPAACLQQLSSLMAPQSVILIVSPYSWMENFTPRDKWLDPGEEKVTALMDSLGFERVLVRDVPLLIREHERKYQYIVSQALGFRRRSA